MSFYFLLIFRKQLIFAIYAKSFWVFREKLQWGLHKRGKETCDGIQAVSYTHLDVYKRQVYYRAVNGTCVVYFDLWIKAVSIDDAVLATDIPYCWLGVYDYKINASSHAPAVFYIQDNALKCGKSNAGRYFGHLVYPTI